MKNISTMLLSAAPLLAGLLLSAHAIADEAPRGTVVSLSATVSLPIENDRLVAHYRIEAEGRDVATLQEQVNKTSHKLRDILSKDPFITLQTTGRNLQAIQHYDKASGRQVNDGWRLVQNERASRIVSGEALGWVSAIERTGARMDGLRFGVSDSVREAALKTLRTRAIRAFKSKAADTAADLGASSFSILRLVTNEGAQPSPMLQRGVMALAAESAPALNPGESEISLTVSGEILLPEKVFPVQ